MKRRFILAAIAFFTVVGIGLILLFFGNIMSPSKDIEKVQHQYEDQLMSLPGVVGLGIGECDGKPCIKVFVTERTPELEAQIPRELDGFRVDIEATDPFQIQPG